MENQGTRKRMQNPEFIEGIYNYCDRWCERCGFTARCLNFALTEKNLVDLETDLNHGDGFEQLYDSLKIAYEMMEEAANHYGVDIGSLDFVDSESEELKKNINENPCYRAALEYTELVDACLDLVEDDAKEEFMSPFADTFEAQDNILWYQHQIGGKIFRALMAKSSATSDSEDANGSAKVAMIGIDRSIDAWSVLMEHFPVHRPFLFRVLQKLEKILYLLEKEFPDARRFIRPGLDELHHLRVIGHA